MATKIKDGLFIGDAEASQDPEFIELNKITFVINCAGRQLPNLWEQCGLHYLTYPWGSDPDCMLFDGGNVVISQIANFIDGALEKGDSVLVHSLDGKGRCVACLTAYLMFKYRWGFEKALDFVCSKRPDAAPNPGFLQQSIKFSISDEIYASVKNVTHVLYWIVSPVATVHLRDAPAGCDVMTAWRTEGLELYHLDLRLCAHWYGPGRDPPKRERIRHDQWVPLHLDSSTIPGEKNQTGAHIAGHQNFDISSESDKNGTRSAPPRSSRRPSSPSPAYTEVSTQVQGEELVLVHSFLNSRPQFNAIRSSLGACEDFEATELHWIDRPRIDKLVSAGYLRPDESRPNIVPISPRTGRPVPERPPTSSYNSLSPSCSLLVKGGPLVGILKAVATRLDQRDEHRKGSSGATACTAYSRFREAKASGGEDSVAVSSSGAKGLPAAAGSNFGGGNTLHQDAERAGPEDEIVVEDLSDARAEADLWEKLQERPTKDRPLADDINLERQGIGRDREVGSGETWQERNAEQKLDVSTAQDGCLLDATGMKGRQARNDSGIPRKTIEGRGETDVRRYPRERSEQRPTGNSMAQTKIKGALFGGRNMQAQKETHGATRGESQDWDGAAAVKAILSGAHEALGECLLENIYRRHNQGQTSSASEGRKPQRDASSLPEFTQRLDLRKEAPLEDRQQGPTPAKAFGRRSEPSGRTSEDGKLKARGGRERKAIDVDLDKSERPMGRDGFLEAKSSREPGSSERRNAPCGSETAGTPSSAATGKALPQGQARHSGSRSMGQGWGQETMAPQDMCRGDMTSEAIKHQDSSSGARFSARSRQPGKQAASSVAGKGRTSQQPPRAPNAKQRCPASPRDDPDYGQAYPVHGRMSPGPSPQLQREERRRWSSSGAENALGNNPLPTSRVTKASGVVGSGAAAGRGDYLAGSPTPCPVGEEPGSSSKESPRAAGRRAARERDVSDEPPPREMWNPAAGAYSVHTQLRPPGTGDPASAALEHSVFGTRNPRNSGDSKPQQVQCGLPKPLGAALPIPYMRHPGDDNAVGPEHGRDRWANPAPCRRQRPSALGHGSSGPGVTFMDDANGGRGQGGGMMSGIRGGIKRPKASCSPVLAHHHPPASRDASRSRSRSRVAPTYRSGSPAPTRGTRNKDFTVVNSGSAAAAAASSSSSSIPHSLGEQKVHRPEGHLQFSKVPPRFSDPIASACGSARWSENAKGRERKSRLPRHNPPSSPAAREYQQREPNSVPPSGNTQRSSAGKTRVEASVRRPSTSEGLLNGGVGARRGRAPRTAPRPSSASGLHRSASSSPANRAGVSYVRESRRMDASGASSGINKPRWK